jgi:hypothetical protein
LTDELNDRAKSFLFARQEAYQQVFHPKNNYTQKVIDDLAKFCRANHSTFHADPRVHAVLEGRREVFLRICHHTKLDSNQLWLAYGRKTE